jgi:predicted RNA-binding protein with PIN domain
MLWLVDGMNMIGSRPDGWWRDRPGARRRLVAELAPLAVRGDRVEVVFDGREAGGEADAAAETGVRVVFAGGGPGAADDVITATAHGPDGAPDTTVVTSDRGLVARLGDTPAVVMGVRAFSRVLADLQPP